MIVVDASVIAVALGDDSAHGVRARTRLRAEILVAPEIVDLEVVSVWRRLLRTGGLTSRRAGEAVDDLLALPMRRMPHGPFLSRSWELRANLTTYDAVYVALAETFGCALLTADRRIAGAPRLRCDVEVFV